MAIGYNYIDNPDYTWEEENGDGGEIDYLADLVVEGNVGIGTTNPSYALTVTGASDVRTRLGLANTTASNYLNFTAYGNTGGGIFWGGFSSANTTAIEASGLLALMSVNGLVFSGNSNGEAMRINSSNNVGIGTTSPGQKLSVAGIVESTSGGFKFPDGTVQTTKAAAASLTVPVCLCTGNNLLTTRCDVCPNVVGYMSSSSS